MTTGKNRDGTIDVRVVLNVRVDPRAWVEDVMEEHPDEVLLREIRKSVKTTIWAHVREMAEEQAPYSDHNYPVLRVHAEGIYE